MRTFTPGMDERTWRDNLHGLGLTPRQAALAINLHCGAVIDPDDTLKQFKRKGFLSQRETAMWALFFRYYRKLRKRHHETA